jgi:arylsulfatase A-like enzyme
MKRQIENIILGLFLLFLGGIYSAVAQNEKRPNIIFIVTDDQHRDQFNFIKEGLDAEGKPTNLSPNIDQLAAEGVIFDNSYVSSSVCTPSRYSIITGTYASRGIGSSNMRKYEGQTNITWNVHVDSKTNNIAKTLQKNGYFTGGVGKNHTIYGHNPHKVSLKADPTDAKIKRQMEENQMAQVKAYKKVGFDYAGAIYRGNLPNQYPVAVEDHNMEWVVDSALNFLNLAAKKKEPFFLYFATTLAHGPDRLGTKYKGNPLATPIGFLDKPLEVMPSRESVTERIAAAGLEREKADILWLDDGIGALLDKLKAINELENTVIFFIDDHGVESGKGTLYEGGIKTVSFVYGPNYIKSGLRSKQLVSNIDMVPTALELAGIDPKKEYDIDGVSMLPLLKGSTKEIHKSLFFEMGATRAVIKDGYKYLAFKAPASIKSKLEKNGKKATHICDKPGGRGSESPALKFYAKNYFDEDQLYQLENDPFEQTNLHLDESKKAKIKELKTELKKYLKIVPGTFPID